MAWERVLSLFLSIPVVVLDSEIPHWPWAVSSSPLGWLIWPAFHRAAELPLASLPTSAAAGKSQLWPSRKIFQTLSPFLTKNDAPSLAYTIIVIDTLLHKLLGSELKMSFSHYFLTIHVEGKSRNGLLNSDEKIRSCLSRICPCVYKTEKFQPHAELLSFLNRVVSQRKKVGRERRNLWGLYWKCNGHFLKGNSLKPIFSLKEIFR